MPLTVSPGLGKSENVRDTVVFSRLAADPRCIVSFFGKNNKQRFEIIKRPRRVCLSNFTSLSVFVRQRTRTLTTNQQIVDQTDI